MDNSLIDEAFGHSTRPFAICKGQRPGSVISASTVSLCYSVSLDNWLSVQDGEICFWTLTSEKRITLLQKIVVHRGPIRALHCSTDVLVRRVIDHGCWWPLVDRFWYGIFVSIVIAHCMSRWTEYVQSRWTEYVQSRGKTFVQWNEEDSIIHSTGNEWFDLSDWTGVMILYWNESLFSLLYALYGDVTSLLLTDHSLRHDTLVMSSDSSCVVISSKLALHCFNGKRICSS